MKKMLSWLLALIIAMSVLAPANGVNASTDTKHWADGIISKWMGLGVIHGYETGDYQPDQLMVRAELVQVLNNLLDLTYTGKENAFKDVAKGSWYADCISKAVAYGFIKGYPDGSFQPNRKIIRQDAVLMIYNALELSKDTVSLQNFKSTFADVNTISPYAQKAVADLEASGDLTFLGKNFEPNKKITSNSLLSFG